MGYLTQQLEKIASAVTDGMEKKALTIADVIRMGKNAVNNGKALHFSKRLAQRNRALANNTASRIEQSNKAYKNLNDAVKLELSFGNAGPNGRELWRLHKRVPYDGTATLDELARISPKTIPSRSYYKTPQDAARDMLRQTHAQISADQLSNIVRNLKKGWGDALI